MNSQTHLLVRLTTRLPIPQTEIDPPNGVYDDILGLWVDPVNSLPLVNDPNRPKPSTKKADVETGEDHKGT